MKKEYSEEVAAQVQKINAFLSKCPQLEKRENSPWEKVLEAENYALSVGGKRIRPLLAVEFYRMFTGCEEVPDFVYEAVCTLEMTHTFSLIHDDMPEMDDDELRRGMPATHVKYGAAVGLLAGDGLAILPYEILSQMALEGKIPFDTAVALINSLSHNAGNSGMIAGQVLDLWSEENPEGIDEVFLRKMSDLKTGCLLTAACEFGAILAGADSEALERVEIYAKNVGLAFQIVDDILDVTSDTETLGKPVMSDRRREKPTFADIYGLKGAADKAKQLSASAAEAIEIFPHSEFLQEFAMSLAVRNK